MITLRKASLLAGTIMAGAMFATPSYAQDAETVETAGTEGGAITVTGSRIPRNDLNSVVPITRVPVEEFALTGAVNIEQVLNVMPQFTAALTGFSNNPGNGAVTLNLRNLGATRTLTLVNGRRWMPFDASLVADANTIPQFLLGGIEVQTGGASAVYGADAVAGVVNFQLRDVQGVEMNGTYGITERGDGAEYQLNAAIGTSLGDGRGNVTMYMNYTRRDAVGQGDRIFSERAADEGCIRPGTRGRGEIGTPLGTTAAVNQISGCAARGGELGFIPGGSAITPIGRINFAPVGSPLAGPQIFTPTGGDIRPFQDPQDLYNFAVDNFLQLPQERYLIGAYGRYEIAPNIEFYSEFSFVRNEVTQQLAPTPGGFANVLLQQNSPFFSPATQAALAPFANAQGFVPATVQFRFNDISDRTSFQNRDAFRIVGGFRGDVTSDIKFDTYYLYGKTSNTNRQIGNVAISRTRNALETEFGPDGALRCRSAAARTAGCVPLNVFGLGLADPAALDYVSVAATNTFTAEIINAVGVLSGTLFDLGAGPIGWSGGVEYRKLRGEFNPDEFLSSGDVVGFNAGLPTAGGYDVKEVFGEVRVPLIRDSFIHLLSLDGAFRYSDYSLAGIGGNWTYNGGLEFAPIEDVRFRGQYSRAVRAPNINDLFSGNFINFPNVTDPCSDRRPVAQQTDAIRALCVAQGVPAANVFTRAVQPNAQIQSLGGGNPNVGQETADTWTAGVVIRPRAIPRLNITADYFDIRVEGTIGTAFGGLGNVLSICFDTEQNLTSPACSLLAGTRSPITGAIGRDEGGANPLVLSDNVGLLETRGIDLAVDYNFPFAGGNVGLFYNATYTMRINSTPVALIPERVNLFRGVHANPEYAHVARVSYQRGPVSGSLRWRHEGPTQDGRIENVFVGIERVGTDPAALPKPFIGAWNLLDLAFTFDVSERLTWNIGVNNLTDAQPPILGSVAGEQANTNPNFFNPLGRQFFTGVTLRM